MNPSHLLVAVGLAGVVALTAACTQPRACTEIGATNGVSITLLGTDRTDDLLAEVCVGGSCATGTLFADGTGPSFVDLAAVDFTTAVDVTVTVRSQTGEVVVPATTARSTPTKVQPNGPDCEPTAYQAAVTVVAP